MHISVHIFTFIPATMNLPTPLAGSSNRRFRLSNSWGTTDEIRPFSPWRLAADTINLSRPEEQIERACSRHDEPEDTKRDRLYTFYLRILESFVIHDSG